jgi:hypothetical protein
VLLQHLRDRRRQRRLAMVNVTNRPNIHVRLAAVKFLFRHDVLFLSSASNCLNLTHQYGNQLRLYLLVAKFKKLVN